MTYPHRSKCNHEFYLLNRDKILEINQHYDDCLHKDRLAPLDVCPCNCYQEQIFLLGSEAQRDQFYGGDDRG